MKKILLSSFALCLCGFQNLHLHAQHFQETPDVIAAGKGYAEVNGQPSSYTYNMSGDNKAPILGWDNENGLKFVQYIHFPRGHVKAKGKIRVTGSFTLYLTITDAADQRVLLDKHPIRFEGAFEGEKTMFDDIMIPHNGWYRFELSYSGERTHFKEFTAWSFYKEIDSERAYLANYLSSPSVHLSNWSSTEPGAPSGEAYNWAYREVMVPSSSDVIGTYCMSQGWSSGYSGIQVNGKDRHDIIFSVWDKGSTDKDKNLPEYLRGHMLDAGKGIDGERFGNEGTRVHILKKGNWWKPGKWVKFLLNTRPEIVNVRLKTADGRDSIIQYQNTIFSGWYKADGIDSDWQYLTSMRMSGAGVALSGLYSFLENYNWPTGQALRTAYYRHAAMKAMSNGNWYERNVVAFSHTDGGYAIGARNDYAQGKTNKYENCFYMSTGGYGPTKQSENIIGINQDQSYLPSDEELQLLERRVDTAILRYQNKEMNDSLNAAMTNIPSKNWVITQASDEETVGEDGKASNALDGNELTFWHSQWTNGGKNYPHFIILHEQKNIPQSIKKISFFEGRGEWYRAKEVEVLTSKNGITWNKAGTYTLENSNRPYIMFQEPLNTAYLKLNFTKGYGERYLTLNEISLKGNYDIQRLKQMAKEILQHENILGGYSSEYLTDLKSAYNDGDIKNVELLVKSLQYIYKNAMPYKYGLVNSEPQINSFRAYQLYNLQGNGVLSVNPKTKVVTLKSAKKTTALNEYKSPANAMNEYNSWLILKSEKNHYYLYNLGAKKFLSIQIGTISLSDSPVFLSVERNGNAPQFRIKNTTLSWNSLAADADKPKALQASYPRNPNTLWELRDNYLLSPSPKLVKRLLAYINGDITSIPLDRKRNEEQSEIIYNLGGKQTKQIQSGIYIQRGEKIFKQ